MLLRPPFFYSILFPQCQWKISHEENAVWLTFDDGPHPTLTSYILEQLERYNAQACFFCVGSQVEKYSAEYELILQKKHLTGNHTFSHIDAWKHNTNQVIEDVQQAEKYISSGLFRPPYGHLAPGVQKYIQQKFSTVMWSLIAYDWLSNLSHERVLRNITDHVQSGDIIVLHDSHKSEKHIRAILPNLLQTLTSRGFTIKNPR